MYIKALEQEVLRLKEAFSNASRERDAFAEENRRLRDLLLAHGIHIDVSSPGAHHVGSSTYGGSSAASTSGGYGPGSSSTDHTSPPSMASQTRGHALSHPPPPPPPHGHNGGALTPGAGGVGVGGGLDYEQIGIDFVLTYDRTPYLSPPP